MSITDQVQRIAEQKPARLAADPGFAKLEEFYRQKREEGAVMKPSYSLPPLDTVGRELYRTLAGRKPSR
ncbi:MAG: hypothetical protein U0Q16_33965 [Bryobacteraceae bacterium]